MDRPGTSFHETPQLMTEVFVSPPCNSRAYTLCDLTDMKEVWKTLLLKDLKGFFGVIFSHHLGQHSQVSFDFNYHFSSYLFYLSSISFLFSAYQVRKLDKS